MYAWMIETADPATGRPLWWTGGGWSPDPNLGIRFARREDGDEVRAVGEREGWITAPFGRYPSEIRVMEHGWDG